MADPLSIAASVVGLVAAAGKVYGVLSNFVSTAADAPSSAASVLETVEQMKLTLSSVQSLIDSIESLDPSRKALIQLDHLSIVITHSVLTISELESIVCPKDGLMHRLRWAWSEKRVMGLLPRLESQKSSLSLMVAVLQSKSELEARTSHTTLLSKVDEVLQQNEALAHRLQRLEGNLMSDSRSVKFFDDASSIISRRLSFLSVRSVDSSSSSISSASQKRQSITITSPSIVARNDFELALERSRVYNRTQLNESDVSFTSSTAPSAAWSMLSGLSLNDISIISAFRLPITLDDIDLLAPGSTFSILLTEQLTATMTTSTTVEAEPRRDDAQTSTQARPRPTRRPTGERNRGSTRLVASALRGYHAKRAIKIVVIGDDNSMKNTILQTYAYPRGATSREYTPKTFENFVVEVKVNSHLTRLALYDTTGQEKYTRLRVLSYQSTSIFLVLSRKTTSSAELEEVEYKWIPEIIQHCPGTPYLIVGTYKNKPGVEALPDNSIEGGRVAERAGAIGYTECDVEDPTSVSATFGQAIAKALGLDKPSGRLRDSLRRRSLKPLIETEQFDVE
ncbi:hypothetical protein NCS57_01308400 [Fusarium keratoplasticum]|uniref:Uncharacterized protein n=1 Tax=Fusarium keratoplasticum TaxID=1328300 RepID=A0ACC0QHJ3_9HYPO|nr:hypothetical protein NCS57_01308400 [Fusarium keratoplasticum]KAI8652444.1 hypothetical protein NCS57_01308400 [Fusarium keratoplasticum]KAI8653178.1 hypothetical protein NCS55_01302200 [Fusarium keratoplasticum]